MYLLFTSLFLTTYDSWTGFNNNLLQLGWGADEWVDVFDHVTWLHHNFTRIGLLVYTVYSFISDNLRQLGGGADVSVDVFDDITWLHPNFTCIEWLFVYRHSLIHTCVYTCIYPLFTRL